MAPGKSSRSAGPALTSTDTTLTVLSDVSHSNPYIPSTFTDGLPLPRVMVFDLDYTLWPFWCDTHISPPLKLVKDNSSSRKADNIGAKGAGGQPFIANKMTDRWGENFGFYSEVPAVLSAAKDRGIILGVASRTHTPDIARDLLKGLTIPVYPPADSSDSTNNPDNTKKSSSSSNNFRITRSIDLFPTPLQQIYPGSKTTHFRKIQEATTSPKLQSQIPGLTKGSPGIDFKDMLFFDDEARNRNVEKELGVAFCLVRDGVSKEEVDRGIWEWRRRNAHANGR